MKVGFYSQSWLRYGNIVLLFDNYGLWQVFGMEKSFAEMAAHNEVGIKLQNLKLLEGSE